MKSIKLLIEQVIFNIKTAVGKTNEQTKRQRRKKKMTELHTQEHNAAIILHYVSSV
jgi:hypothetical protein